MVDLNKNDGRFTFNMVSEQLADMLGFDSPKEMMGSHDEYGASGRCKAGNSTGNTGNTCGTNL